MVVIKRDYRYTPKETDRRYEKCAHWVKINVPKYSSIKIIFILLKNNFNTCFILNKCLWIYQCFKNNSHFPNSFASTNGIYRAISIPRMNWNTPADLTYSSLYYYYTRRKSEIYKTEISTLSPFPFQIMQSNPYQWNVQYVMVISQGVIWKECFYVIIHVV